jgi:hypothetical protein
MHRGTSQKAVIFSECRENIMSHAIRTANNTELSVFYTVGLYVSKYLNVVY